MFQNERISCLFNASAYERLRKPEIAAKICILYALKTRGKLQENGAKKEEKMLNESENIAYKTKVHKTIKYIL